MTKIRPVFALYLRKEFLGIQRAKSAASAKVLYATRGGVAWAGNILPELLATMASAAEIQQACAQCRQRKEDTAKEFCPRCQKLRKRKRRQLIAILRKPALCAAAK